MSRIYGVFVAVAVAEGPAVGLPGVFVRVAVAGVVRVAVADGLVPGVGVAVSVGVGVVVAVGVWVGTAVVGAPVADARTVVVGVAASVGVGDGESPPPFWVSATASAIPPPISSAPPISTAQNGPVPALRRRATRAVS